MQQLQQSCNNTKLLGVACFTVYLLYWYKSTNTDAGELQHKGPDRAHELLEQPRPGSLIGP